MNQKENEFEQNTFNNSISYLNNQQSPQPQSIQQPQPIQQPQQQQPMQQPVLEPTQENNQPINQSTFTNNNYNIPPQNINNFNYSNQNLSNISNNAQVPHNENNKTPKKKKTIKFLLIGIGLIITIITCVFALNYFKNTNNNGNNKNNNNISSESNINTYEKSPDGYYTAYEDEYVKLEYGDYRIEGNSFIIPTRYTNKVDYEIGLDDQLVQFNNVSTINREWFGRNMKPKEISEEDAEIYLAAYSIHHYESNINKVAFPIIIINQDKNSPDYFKEIKNIIVTFKWDNDIEYETIKLGKLVFSDNNIDVYHYTDYEPNTSDLTYWEDGLYIYNKSDNILELSFDKMQKENNISTCSINEINGRCKFIGALNYVFIMPNTYTIDRVTFATIEDSEEIEQKTLNYIKSKNINTKMKFYYTVKCTVENQTFTCDEKNEKNLNYVNIEMSDYN